MHIQLALFPDDPPAAIEAPVGPVRSPSSLHQIAERLSDGLRLGTSSWSFPGWEGSVYDRRVSESLLARHGLSAYARHPLLRTVGIDRTFYRSIGAADFRAYADMVPADFRFLVKADRLLTSPVAPEPFGTRDANPHFLDATFAASEVIGPLVEGLGQAAGPILFQFPPMPASLVGGRGPFMERLHRFLDALPKGPLYAVELRTPSFLDESYAQLLYDTGASHCFNVHPAMTPLARQFEVLSSFAQPTLVIRWMLHAGFRYEVAKERYAPFDRIVDEDLASRERIAVAVLDALIAERGVFVIANNKAEGSAPLSIVRLAERIANWKPQESFHAT